MSRLARLATSVTSVLVVGGCGTGRSPNGFWTAPNASSSAGLVIFDGSEGTWWAPNEIYLSRASFTLATDCKNYAVDASGYVTGSASAPRRNGVTVVSNAEVQLSMNLEDWSSYIDQQFRVNPSNSELTITGQVKAQFTGAVRSWNRDELQLTYRTEYWDFQNLLATEERTEVLTRNQQCPCRAACAP